ncbi:PP2C-domain-containing protein [Rhizopus microsporus ATCC 52813]|uniref:protein-serine/threonine phosphatase n=1 Tax=Rhizopus microsporus ATCC 52813 TaxID=1340429 RepID=A0A2G4T1Z9_RHIZD|nr:PP2C-domain-containing protein [Rhizopus microsporus ATCC 52813]PHZ15032.1 PP2C-domain-containing protein [Rhizopus microsporus ATCC 52813]
MGQILSEPVTTKHSTSGKDERLIYGASSMQGWRITMEDAHTTILNYENTGTAFFAVFDGHGGDKVAKYSSQHLPANVIESEAFKKGDIKESLKEGFLKIDSDLHPELQHDPSGCTAIVALLTKDNMLYIGNAGDSRAIICTNGRAIALSDDHKPSNPKETARIEKAGGHVEFGRVNGNLALSRALGDFEFKSATNLPPEQQVVTADPDITKHKITEKDEFMVLACDGIWDCMTNQEVASFVRQQIAEHAPLETICEKLMDHCLADQSGTTGVGCDNMTVEIIAFLQGQTEEEWYKKISESEKGASSKTTSGGGKGIKSESRQYTENELKKAPDLTSSLASAGSTHDTAESKSNVKSEAKK